MAASDALSPAQKHQAYKRWKLTGQQTGGMYFSNALGGGQSSSYSDYDEENEDDDSYGDGGGEE